MLLIYFCDDKEFSCRKMAFLERKHKFFSKIVLREMYSVYLFFDVAEDESLKGKKDRCAEMCDGLFAGSSGDGRTLSGRENGAFKRCSGRAEG